MPGNTTGASQITMEAAADFRTTQYGAMYQDTSNMAAMVVNGLLVTQEPIGVLYNNPNIGLNALIRKFDGNGKVVINAGEAISVGDRITISTSGMAITANSIGAWQVGRAETAAGATGERISMWTSVPVRVNSLT